MVNEKLNKKIEKEIIDTLEKDPIIGKKVDEEIKKDIEKELSVEIDQKVKEVIQEQIQPASKIAKPVAKLFGFSLCLNGSCRFLLIIAIVSYILISGVMLICLIPVSGLCLQKGLLGAGNYLLIVATAALALSIISSVILLKSKDALITSFILNIPIVILMIILTIQYIGYLILGIGFILFLSRVIRR